MAISVNTTATRTITLATAGQTFTRVSSSIAGTATVWNPVFTDNADGTYTATKLVDQIGSWIWEGTSTDGSSVQLLFDVVLDNTLYTTLAVIKNRLDVKLDTNNADIEQIIEAASRKIDGYTNRRYYQITEARYFTADDTGELDIDDLVTLTALATDETSDRTYGTTWIATDYDLEPYNAAAIGWPYTRIMIAPNGRYGFPRVRRGVKITATWGWPDIPSGIAEAATLMTIRLFSRIRAPYGVVGNSDLGQQTLIPSIDPDVKQLLEPFRRFLGGSI